MSSSAELIGVPRELVEEIWPVAAPFLEKGVKQTRKVTLESLQKSAAQGLVQLWLAYDPESKEILAACATDLFVYESGYKTARVLILGGFDVNRWSECIATIEEWAVAEDCDAVEIAGRKGWARIYPDYAPAEYWLQKEIR